MQQKIKREKERKKRRRKRTLNFFWLFVYLFVLRVMDKQSLYSGGVPYYFNSKMTGDTEGDEGGLY